MDIEKINERIDKTVVATTEMSAELGGVQVRTMGELGEFAKLMSVSGTAVPRHLRGNPGSCLAICTQAMEWHMSPFSVANKSYEVSDRVAYEAQLIMAVINTRAPLQKRLRYTYDGDGDAMTCTVSGLLKGEVDPLEYTSPQISTIKVKNSPLWKSDPAQQLAYFSARNWARRYCPEVILGIYAEDELRDAQIGPENAKDITPAKGLKDRLKGQGKRPGFHESNANALPPPSATDQVIDFTPAPAKEPVAVGGIVVEENVSPSEVHSAPEDTSGHVAEEPATTATSEQAPSQDEPTTAMTPEEIQSEVNAKIDAIRNADSTADLNALWQSTKEFLQKNNGAEYLQDLYKAVNDRNNSLKRRSK